MIVDDDAEFHQQIRYAFRRNFTFEGATTPELLERKLRERDDYDLVLMDLVLDESQKLVGLDLIADLSARYPILPIVAVTADREIDTVVMAMKAGARDFLTKGGYDYDYWHDKFVQVIEGNQLKTENQRLKAEVKKHRETSSKTHAFIGSSAKVEDIKRILRLVSEEPDVTVLLLGETGTGKEIAARYLHQNGVRSDRPFQAVNLSAIQSSLLESTLFGHRKGAFTGATKDTDGYFIQANTGILMLDEIGDIDMSIQIKLLRFLETKLIRPVGADKDILLDVQIVAATHRNLAEEVEKGHFRADLYQRLKAMVIEIPPLRERREDILAIIQHYLEDLPAERIIPPDVQKLLLAYEWVGNIRELKNTINYMLLRRKIKGLEQIDISCLPPEIQQSQQASAPAAATVYGTGPAATSYAVPLQEFSPTGSVEETYALLDLRQIEASMMRKNKVKKDVALELGLENTDNLRYRIKKHYDKYPHLFTQFPFISESYRKIVKR